MNIQPISKEDIMLWSDGTWCYREDLPEYQYMSDDFYVVSVSDPMYEDIHRDLDAKQRTTP